jgi:hypothetical protein
MSVLPSLLIGTGCTARADLLDHTIAISHASIYKHIYHRQSAVCFCCRLPNMRNDGSGTTLLSTSLSEKSRQHWTLSDLVPRSAIRGSYLTLLCLHVLLIIIHLVLVAVIFAPPEGHLEHRFSLPIGPQANALQVAIVVTSQAFNVVSHS